MIQLPAFRPKRVQAPADEGVGLVIPVRTVPPSWPPDWWQRNYDQEPDAPDPRPLTAREKAVPPPPAVTP